MARRLKSPSKGRGERPEIDRDGLATLSSREQQVLGLAAEGFLDKQISSELGVSINTLRTYWTRIRSKVGEVPRSALAVAYTGQATAAIATVAEDEVDWIIDLDRYVYHRVSERHAAYESAVGVDLSLDEVLTVFHPAESAPNSGVVRRAWTQPMTFPNSRFAARAITPKGIQIVSAVIRVERDETGKATLLYGRRMPNMDVRAPDILNVEVGYWQRDLSTNVFTCDLAFCKIFNIDPADADIRSAALRKFHPDEADMVQNFVDNAIAHGKGHERASHRLQAADGSFRWATTDLRIEYEGSTPVRALGTVMVFQ